MTDKANRHPFALSETLRDLAILRASDIDLDAVLDSSLGHNNGSGGLGSLTSTRSSEGAASATEGEKGSGSSGVEKEKTDGAMSNSTSDSVDSMVERSFSFATAARAAVRILHSGTVDRQGSQVERIRGDLEDVLEGLAGGAECDS